jgi:hypothetical protein
MGERLRKRDLLLEIERERSALDASLAALTPRPMARPGVTRGGWSVKDILAHPDVWQQLDPDRHSAGREVVEA